MMLTITTDSKDKKAHKTTSSVVAIEKRKDIKLARRQLRLQRKLCKVYGLSFQMPDGIYKLSRRKKLRTNSEDDDEDCSEEDDLDEDDGNVDIDGKEDSSEDVSSEDDPMDLNHLPKWSEVQSRLSTLRPEERVKELDSLNQDMILLSIKAVHDTKQLDKLERVQGKARELKNHKDMVANSDAVLDEDDVGGRPELLDFDMTDTAAVQALMRCTRRVPILRDQVTKKEALLKAEREAHRLALEALPESSDSNSDDEEGAESLKAQVRRQLRQYAKLPPGSSLDLHRVLQAQRQEVHALVASITKAEKDLEIKKLTLEHLEGRLDTTEVEPDKMRKAIAMANEAKGALLREAIEDAEKEFKLHVQEQGEVPTALEMDAILSECNRLETEYAALRARIEMMKVEQHNLVHREVNGTSKQKTGTDNASRRLIALDATQGNQGEMLTFEVEHEYAKLEDEIAELQSSLNQVDGRVEAAEAIIRNAEATLRTLESTKHIFLEQVGVENPDVIQELLRAHEVRYENLDKEEMESGNEEENIDVMDAQRPTMERVSAEAQIEQLAAEERWLRTQIEEALESVSNISAGVDDADRAEEFAIVAGVERLVRRIERLQGLTQSEDDDQDSVSQEDDDDNLSSEMAIAQLRALPHQSLKEVVALRQDNERLLDLISQEHVRVQRLRSRMGDPKHVLSGEAPLDASPDIPPGLAADVRRKARELNALRRRWWCERQDPNTTVRRALAVVGLPDDIDKPDNPPISLYTTIFERIHASMTLT